MCCRYMILCRQDFTFIELVENHMKLFTFDRSLNIETSQIHWNCKFVIDTKTVVKDSKALLSSKFVNNKFFPSAICFLIFHLLFMNYVSTQVVHIIQCINTRRNSCVYIHSLNLPNFLNLLALKKAKFNLKRKGHTYQT